MSKKSIRIGTRGSKLALYQAGQVQDIIRKLDPDAKIEIVVIKTKGDKILDVALSKIGDKGLFTKELEVALAARNIDMAVHSLKDLPTTLPADFRIGAVLERGDARDGLVSAGNRTLKELPPGARIGTSSLRRQASLLHYNPELQIIDIRGNVSTRLEKMERGDCDAVVMAVAGLERLGLGGRISEILDPVLFIPAVSQGIIAAEVRENDSEILGLCNEINHEQSWNSARMERAFLRTLEGGCQVPAGCYTKYEEDATTISGFIASPDGHDYVSHQLTANLGEPEDTGRRLATGLLDMGGREILKALERR